MFILLNIIALIVVIPAMVFVGVGVGLLLMKIFDD